MEIMNLEEQIAESMIKRIKHLKSGRTRSVEELMNKYFNKEKYAGADLDKVYDLLFENAREHDILLDTSKSYGNDSCPKYQQEFVVFNRNFFMPKKTFEDFYIKYDTLFINLDVLDPKFEKKKKRILTDWKKQYRPLKAKKLLYVKDIDNSPFEEPVPEVLPKKNINIIPIGSGSNGNTFYIEIGDYRILIDAGMSVKKISKALEKNGRNIKDVDALFLTHAHDDHIKCLRSIKKAIQCPVYCGWLTLEHLKKLGLDGECISLCEVEQDEVLPGLEISLVCANHDFYDTYGYIFENENAKISYLTDFNDLRNNQLKCMSGSDVVVLEANYDLDMLNKKDNDLNMRISMSHTSNVRCGVYINYLHDQGTRNFLLAHVSRANNTYDLALSTVKKILRSKWANIHVCRTESDELLSY